MEEVKIKPTSADKEEYVLPDEDYCLIMAIRELTKTIDKLRVSLK